MFSKLNANTINDYERDRAKKKEKLRALISTPFDLSAEAHTKALKEYLNAFELSVNQMYLYQSISSGLTVYLGSFIVGRFLPIPEFATTFLTASLYAGIGGYLLSKFSMTDFYEQLSEMKEIYNWSLKGGLGGYSSAIDNKIILADADIQRMIKLMAPLCNTDFMIAWSRESTEDEAPKGVLSNVFSFMSKTVSYISSPSGFFESPKEAQNQNRIRELKIAVETRSFDLGEFAKFEQSIRYLASNSDFHQLLTAKIKAPIDAAKNMIPGAISSIATAQNK